MTLRDWLAGQYITGAASHPKINEYPFDFVRAAYMVADAALLKRADGTSDLFDRKLAAEASARAVTAGVA